MLSLMMNLIKFEYIKYCYREILKIVYWWQINKVKICIKILFCKLENIYMYLQKLDIL